MSENSYMSQQETKRTASYGSIRDDCTIYEQISQLLISEETAVVWIAEFLTKQLGTLIAGNQIISDANKDMALNSSASGKTDGTELIFRRMVAGYESIVFGSLQLAFSVWSGCKPLLQPAYGRSYSLASLILRGMAITGESFHSWQTRLQKPEASLDTLLALCGELDRVLPEYTAAPSNRLLPWFNKRHVVRIYMNAFYEKQGTSLTYYRTHFPVFYLRTYYA